MDTSRRRSPSPLRGDEDHEITPRTPAPVVSEAPLHPPTQRKQSVAEGTSTQHPTASSSVTGALTDPSQLPASGSSSLASQSSLPRLPVHQHPQTRITIDTSIPGPSNIHGPRHPSLQASIPTRDSPEEDEHGSNSVLIPHRATPPPPPPPSTKPRMVSIGESVYNPRGDFAQPLNSPGLAAQPGSAAQAAYMQPQVPRPVRTRSQYASRSRMSLAGGDNNHMNPVDENGVNWIVPPERPVLLAEKNVRERLFPTLEEADKELKKAQFQAKSTGWSLNVAIGAQVVLGAFTTGIAAATTGKTTSVVTSILGGLSTLAASYLAKARGSGEPEASTIRCRDLEQFVRDCNAFILDKGHLTGDIFDPMIEGYRKRLEEVLGNTGNAVKETVKGKEKLNEREKLPPV